MRSITPAIESVSLYPEMFFNSMPHKREPNSDWKHILFLLRQLRFSSDQWNNITYKQLYLSLLDSKQPELPKTNSRGGVEDTRLEAKAKDKENPSLRPRPRKAFSRTDPLEAKHTATSVRQKKRSSKTYFRHSPIHRRTQNF